MTGKIKKINWHWTHVAGALLLSLVAIYVALPAWADMYQIAVKDEESSHILLVPIAIAWLVWIRRGRLRQCRVEPTLLGPFIIAIGWVISSVGFWNNIESFWHGGRGDHA